MLHSKLEKFVLHTNRRETVGILIEEILIVTFLLLGKDFCKMYLVQGDGWWLSERGKYKQSEKGKYRQSCVVSYEATAVDAARLAARPRSSVPGQTYPYSTYSLENFQPRGIMKNKH